jgi:putative transposase
MPYWRLFYHFVWGTKHGEPLMDSQFEQTLYRAIGAKATDLGGIVHAMGGVSDHVHLVTSVPPKVALSTFIGQVKGSSAHFVNHEIRPGYGFYWQDEFGVVSFGERQLSWVVRYVHDQAQHHALGSALGRLECASDP